MLPVELAPLLSLCRRIVDLVSTGSTLRANDLEAVAGRDFRVSQHIPNANEARQCSVAPDAAAQSTSSMSLLQRN